MSFSPHAAFHDLLNVGEKISNIVKISQLDVHVRKAPSAMHSTSSKNSSNTQLLRF